MTTDPLRGARGPRRATWPADGLDRALAEGGRRLRRRRVVAGTATLASVVTLGTAVVALGRSTSDLQPATGGHIARRMVHDPAACTKRQRVVPPFPADAGYCVFLTGATVVTPGVREPYTFRLCRRTGAGADVIELSADDEFTANVRPRAGGAPVYRWGKPTEHKWHEVAFRDGECREWSFVWDGRTLAGGFAPSGRYVVFGITAQVAWEPEQKPVGLGSASAELEVTLLSGRAPRATPG